MNPAESNDGPKGMKTSPSPGMTSLRHPAWSMGIDVGGTKMAAGLLSLPDGSIRAQRQQPTHSTRGGQAVLGDVLNMARELVAEAGSLGQAVHSIGLSVCELVDRDGRLASSNCLDWLELPVREELSLMAPALIEADVRAGALAEALFGAGQAFRSFVYVSVGTGISGCLMLEAAPYLGARGLAGTMASSPLAIPCEQCGHISGRSLEEIAAGPALVARYQSMGGQARNTSDVISAAEKGDPLAREVVVSASEALSSQVGLLVNMLDPEAVIVGGGLGLSEGLYWEHFLATVRRYIWSNLHRGLPILRAATGPAAGWIGAAARAGLHFRGQDNASDGARA